MPLQPHGKTLCYEAILSMKQSFQLKLGQSLAMTPQLQQAIKLLQLSTLELQQEIQQALESNPMLEMLEAGDAPDDDLPRISDPPGCAQVDPVPAQAPRPNARA